METQLYLYQGPVSSFRNIICTEYKCYTEAPSMGKALSNVMHRFRKEKALAINTKLEVKTECLSVVDVGSIAPDED